MQLVKGVCLAAPGAWHLSETFNLERGTVPADTKALPDETPAVTCHSDILYTVSWPPTEPFVPLKSSEHRPWDLRGLHLILEPAAVTSSFLFPTVAQVHISSFQHTPSFLSLA